MDRKEDREMLRRVGFAEIEMNRLAQLRREHNERERREAIAHRRRLEFARWLISKGKLSEQIA
ncbi:MAG TPA: hypothetical protein VEV19_15865 [Ktedonobacteraceae bacterium]|nr:hypothetical protein [Ktedonobacteraceae bacterium]